MKIWEEFEQDCVKYLNKKFASYAIFKLRGSENSTVSDIEVFTNNGKHFFIEVKHSPAQCGQFVLISDDENSMFKYSSKNAISVNEYSKKIIDYMNGRYELYSNAGTKGENIDMPMIEKVSFNWIESHYKAKDVLFFISNDFTIIPLNQISEYFFVKAVYRIKKSGSSKVALSRINEVSNYIQSIENYYIEDISIDNGSIYCQSMQNLDKEKFILNDNEYMFSKKENAFEIRKLSNTFNANVIFQITLKENLKGLSDEEFISQL